MNAPVKPSVLFVYYTHTQQSLRVAEAMAEVLRQRGCIVSLAGIDLTDARYANRFDGFPFRHVFRDILPVLPAQLRGATGEIRIPEAARKGDYDLVCFGSPTWWFKTNLPLRSYLKSDEAGKVLFGILPPMPTITRHTFHGEVANIASGMIPRVYGRSYAIEADLSIPSEGAEGVIVAEADEMGGFSLWVDGNGLLHHTYSMMALRKYEQVATEPLPSGDVTVTMQFDADEAKPGTGGNVSLWANDKQIGGGRMDDTVALRFSFYAGMDVGRDNGMTVDPAYRAKAPYTFTGAIKKVVFDLKPASHEEEQKLHEEAQHAGVAAAITG